MADVEGPPRRLVICCDGTNNTLTAGVEDTNVLQLYGHLRQNAAPALGEAVSRFVTGASTDGPESEPKREQPP